MTPVRKVVLERLLEDWEDGSVTDSSRFTPEEYQEVCDLYLAHLVARGESLKWWTLPPAGLTAARHAREEQSHD